MILRLLAVVAYISIVQTAVFASCCRRGARGPKGDPGEDAEGIGFLIPYSSNPLGHNPAPFIDQVLAFSESRTVSTQNEHTMTANAWTAPFDGQIIGVHGAITAMQGGTGPLQGTWHTEFQIWIASPTTDFIGSPQFAIVELEPGQPPLTSAVFSGHSNPNTPATFQAGDRISLFFQQIYDGLDDPLLVYSVTAGVHVRAELAPP